MLFNCLQCGKMISANKEICPYCHKDMSTVIEELKNIPQKKSIFSKTPNKNSVIERYKGTILSLMLRS